MVNRTKLTATNKRRFVELLAKQAEQGLPNVSTVCQIIGISRTAAYAAKDKDHRFSQAWDDAVAAAFDTLESEAFERARGYVDQQTLADGSKVRRIKGASDLMTIFLLKGKYPERYRDNYQPTTNIDARGSSLVINLGTRESGVNEIQTQSSAKPRKGWRGHIYEQAPGAEGTAPVDALTHDYTKDKD